MITKHFHNIKLSFDKSVEREDRETIKHAVTVFGFLLPNGTSGFRDLAIAIEKNYFMDNERTGAMVRVLKRHDPYKAKAA